MSRPPLLTDHALSLSLPSIKGWSVRSDGKALEKTFTFDTFAMAFSFMGKVAQEAEALDHHPDWYNSYNRVEISLQTHDVGGITKLDIALAKAINSIAAL